MLEEYRTGNSPDIWDIWVWTGYEPMNLAETEAYFDEVGVPCWKDEYNGSLSSNINHVKQRIDLEWPLDITAESQWGGCHAVVIRGYHDTQQNSRLRDPNTVSGTNLMSWRHWRQHLLTSKTTYMSMSVERTSGLTDTFMSREV